MLSNDIKGTGDCIVGNSCEKKKKSQVKISIQIRSHQVSQQGSDINIRTRVRDADSAKNVMNRLVTNPV